MADDSEQWTIWLNRHLATLILLARQFELKSKLIFKDQPVTLTVGKVKKG